MSAAARVAHLAFWAHVALIAFSTVSMVTILAGPPDPWLATEPAATVMRLSFRFAGPAYVVLGMIAALTCLAARLDWPRALALAAVAIGISLGSELLGTATGLPFGDYAYSGMLGYRILNRVPFPIPLSWFYMLVGALAIVARLSPARDDGRTRWAWSAWAALLLVGWDVAMDPAMVNTGHWAWGPGTMFRDAGLPAWLVDFFTRGAFYGMPLGNWFGWLVTAALAARAMLAIAPPVVVAARVAPSRLPILLYAVNGIMPVVLCMRDGAWWAAAFGTAAMLVPTVLALRRPIGWTRPGATA